MTRPALTADARPARRLAAGWISTAAEVGGGCMPRRSEEGTPRVQTPPGVHWSIQVQSTGEVSHLERKFGHHGAVPGPPGRRIHALWWFNRPALSWA